MDAAQVNSKINIILVEELEALEKRIKANILSNGAHASGKTADSLRIEVQNGRGVLYSRTAFGTLETGRKAGKVPRGFYLIIREWAQNKNIPVDNINSFAYLVARKIALQGTVLYRGGGRNTIYSKELPTTIEKIQARVLEILTQAVSVKSIPINK